MNVSIISFIVLASLALFGIKANVKVKFLLVTFSNIISILGVTTLPVSRFTKALAPWATRSIAFKETSLRPSAPVLVRESTTALRADSVFLPLVKAFIISFPNKAKIPMF